MNQIYYFGSDLSSAHFHVFWTNWLKKFIKEDEVKLGMREGGAEVRRWNLIFFDILVFLSSRWYWAFGDLMTPQGTIEIPVQFFIKLFQTSVWWKSTFVCGRKIIKKFPFTMTFDNIEVRPTSLYFRPHSLKTFGIFKFSWLHVNRTKILKTNFDINLNKNQQNLVKTLTEIITI
jgi:hypothetical protein